MRSCRLASGAGRGALRRSSVPALNPESLLANVDPPLALARQSTQHRCFASGAYQGFPFGNGFPGGPPRGDTEKLYSLLGVDKHASDKDIKQAYKKLAMKHHPDRGGDETKFKEISKAYEVLSSPEKRQAYDQFGEAGLDGMDQGGGPTPDPFDLFSQIFGFKPGGGQARQRPRTPDSQYELQLSLEELYAGTKRSIAFNREVLCPTCDGKGGHERSQCSKCNGNGRVVYMQQMGAFVQHMEAACAPCGGKGYVIPPHKICKTCHGKCTIKEKKHFDIQVESGVEDGTEFRFRGQSDDQPGHETGDVVIIIREKQHSVFSRQKDNLVMRKKISLAEALCGFQITTTFLDGEELVIRSSPGQVVRPGDVMSIEGKGMPRKHGQSTGNLYLSFDIEFPDSLAAEQQKQIAQTLGGKILLENPDAAFTKKLSQRQIQNLHQQSAHGSKAQNHGRRGQNSKVDCVQQ